MEGLVMKYFVLKPKGNDVYAKASREAMRAYAAVIRTDNPDLSKGLILWAGEAAKEGGRGFWDTQEKPR